MVFSHQKLIFQLANGLNLLKKIYEISKKNKIPIIVGGTGLYFKAIINGISKILNIKNQIEIK